MDRNTQDPFQISVYCNDCCETRKASTDCPYIHHNENNTFPTAPLVPHLASEEPLQDGRMLLSLPVGTIWAFTEPPQHRPDFPMAAAPEEAAQEKSQNKGWKQLLQLLQLSSGTVKSQGLCWTNSNLSFLQCLLHCQVLLKLLWTWSGYILSLSFL